MMRMVLVCWGHRVVVIVWINWAQGADNIILMATLGKALGTGGAFVAGSAELIETLIQQARTFIYTTASSPALAWATRDGFAAGARG